MQLLVIAFLILMSGQNANIKELKPIIEELGGEDAAAALKQAEELSGMISAVQSLAALNVPAKPDGNAAPPAFADEVQAADGAVEDGDCVTGGYPLAPIANIADERITYCLSRYISMGE